MDYSEEEGKSNLPRIKTRFPCRKSSFYFSPTNSTASTQSPFRNYFVTQKAFPRLSPAPLLGHYLDLSHGISELLILCFRNPSGLGPCISISPQIKAFSKKKIN